MKKQAEVKGYQVQAKEWKNYGKNRIYFTIQFPPRAGSKKFNQLCYDLDTQEFVGCSNNLLRDTYWNNDNKQEWKDEIKIAFEL